MTKRRRAKVNAKGRNEFERYVIVTYPMIESQAWRTLTPAALKIWFELRSKFNGSNNGELSLSFAKAAKILGLGRSTITAAFNDLEEKGFIELKLLGQWYGRKATEWRVTDQRYKGKPATNEWRNWKPGMSFIKTDLGPETEHINSVTVPVEDCRT